MCVLRARARTVVVWGGWYRTFSLCVIMIVKSSTTIATSHHHIAITLRPNLQI